MRNAKLLASLSAWFYRLARRAAWWREAGSGTFYGDMLTVTPDMPDRTAGNGLHVVAQRRGMLCSVFG